MSHETIRQLRDALAELDARFRLCFSNSAISASEAYDSFYQDIAREALAAADAALGCDVRALPLRVHEERSVGRPTCSPSLAASARWAGGGVMKYATYLIYIVLWEGLIFGGAGYAVFVLDRSGWWFLVAVLIGGCAYSPSKWFYPPDKEA